MARDLPTGLTTDVLANCTSYTTLKITMASGVILRFATADIVIAGQNYLGRLNATDTLKISLTNSIDRIGFEIDNSSLALGQALIAEPYALDGCLAVVGTYFKKGSDEWHVEKITGEILTSEINGDVVAVNFVSETDAAEFYGETVAALFPDAVSTAPPPSPGTEPPGRREGDIPRIIRRKEDPDGDIPGRHEIPEGLTYYAA